MSFDRLKTQVFFEQQMGCNDCEQLHQYADVFKGISLSRSQVNLAKPLLLDDAKDTYFKALLSLFQGVHDLLNGMHSWAVVKFYYSCFYFLRTSLALNEYALLRVKGLYLLELSEGQQPSRKNGHGDHRIVLKIHKDIFSSRDILYSNTIEGEDVYTWLRKCREEVNYRSRIFLEPLLHDYFAQSERFGYEESIELYAKDSVPVYCFDKDHAALALPIVRAIQSKKEFEHKGVALTDDQVNFLSTLLPQKLTSLMLTK